MLESGLRLIEERGMTPFFEVLHMYLHSLEMSPNPDKALPGADTLYNLWVSNS